MTDDDDFEPAAQLVIGHLQGTGTRALLAELDVYAARLAADQLAEMLAQVVTLIGGTPAGMRSALIAHRMNAALARVT